MSGFGASASRRSSAARARTGFAMIPPIPIWASETPRSPRTPHSASGSTITTWFRTRKPRRQRWRHADQSETQGQRRNRRRIERLAQSASAYAPAEGKLAAAMATIKARRRLRRDGVERSNDFNCRIAQFLPRRRKQMFRDNRRKPENGTAEGPCRGRGKNSNAAIARSRLRSGFFAVTGPATVEIFSAKIQAARACATRIRRPEPLRRRKAESPLETPGIAGPDLGVDDARRPLAVERVEKLLGGDPAHVRRAPLWSRRRYAGSPARCRTAAADDPAAAAPWTRRRGRLRRSVCCAAPPAAPPHRE